MSFFSFIFCRVKTAWSCRHTFNHLIPNICPLIAQFDISCTCANKFTLNLISINYIKSYKFIYKEFALFLNFIGGDLCIRLKWTSNRQLNQLFNTKLNGIIISFLEGEYRAFFRGLVSYPFPVSISELNELLVNNWTTTSNRLE